MLHRDDTFGLIVVTQPAHAWISGQIARAWGNAEFGSPEPANEILLAAEQHDIGWLEWEQSPTLNRNTGKPHSFLELPVPVHTKIWQHAGPTALIQGGPYVALLVSRHGSGLYERRDTSADSPQDAQTIRDYLTDAHAFESRMIELLRGDSRLGNFVEPVVLARNSRLVGLWDHLSLVICMGMKGERVFEHVPDSRGETKLSLSPLNADGTEIAVSPWPFSCPAVTLQCEARRLKQSFTEEEEMRRALATPARVSLKFLLSPKK